MPPLYCRFQNFFYFIQIQEQPSFKILSYSLEFVLFYLNGVTIPEIYYIENCIVYRIAQ